MTTYTPADDETRGRLLELAASAVLARGDDPPKPPAGLAE
jgi:hypothetical protein